MAVYLGCCDVIKGYGTSSYLPRQDNEAYFQQTKLTRMLKILQVELTYGDWVLSYQIMFYKLNQPNLNVTFRKLSNLWVPSK